MTTTDPKEIGSVQRQRYNISRHRRRTVELWMAALVLGVIYLAVTVVFIAVLLLR